MKTKRTMADKIFSEIYFPSSIEDSDGWEDEGPNVLKRNVYLLDETDAYGPTIHKVFKIEFEGIVPSAAFLDDKEIPLP